SAPTGIDVSACSDGSAHTGSATVVGRETGRGYTLASGGSVTTAPSQTVVGSSSAYAAAKITATGCESATRTLVTATVNALPSAPTGIDVTACSDGSVHTGSAIVGTGQSVVWYTLASGGSVTTAPSRTGVGSSSAYAAAKITATGCESATRTLVTVTINPLPSQYTVTGGGTFCSTQSGV